MNLSEALRRVEVVGLAGASAATGLTALLVFYAAAQAPSGNFLQPMFAAAGSVLVFAAVLTGLRRRQLLARTLLAGLAAASFAIGLADLSAKSIEDDDRYRSLTPATWAAGLLVLFLTFEAAYERGPVKIGVPGRGGALGAGQPITSVTVSEPPSSLEPSASTAKETSKSPARTNRRPALSIDAKYQAYAEVYTTLDRLIWAIPAFLIAVLALGLTIISGTDIDSVRLEPFSHKQTVGLAYFVVAGLLALGVYGMYRLRFHHSLMGRHLATLEGSGYFADRERQVEWRQSGSPIPAPFAFMIVFAVVATLLAVIGILVLAT